MHFISDSYPSIFPFFFFLQGSLYFFGFIELLCPFALRFSFNFSCMLFYNMWTGWRCIWTYIFNIDYQFALFAERCWFWAIIHVSHIHLSNEEFPYRKELYWSLQDGHSWEQLNQLWGLHLHNLKEGSTLASWEAMHLHGIVQLLDVYLDP